jgi:hypothetical protein
VAAVPAPLTCHNRASLSEQSRRGAGSAAGRVHDRSTGVCWAESSWHCARHALIADHYHSRMEPGLVFVADWSRWPAVMLGPLHALISAARVQMTSLS